MAVTSDELEKSDRDEGEKQEQDEPAARPSRRQGPRPRYLPRAIAGIRRFLGVTVFSSLTRRIVFLNLAALAALVAGILYLNQWRAGLIEARVQSLRTQGQIISAAIAASATVDSDVISVNPDRLLEMLPGSNISSMNFFDPALEFPISPERVAPLLRELVTPTRTRARIYDTDGLQIIDSANIYTEGDVLAATNPTTQPAETNMLQDWWHAAMTWVPGSRFSLYQEYGPSEGKRYPEVNVALNGSPADIVRVDSQGRLVVSVAVPVQRSRNVVGALLLSTQPGEIDSIIATERLGILRLALVAAVVTSILSFFLAGTIAGPMRRLAAAAERVQASMKNRAEIPDFTDRADEIGHLSGSLRSMTNALYNRIEAIERFAADVAHELKNPLTSLRSAVETLPLVRSEQDRERLTGIIQDDVRRLDRLISDISNASRLDAELARETADRVDIEQLCDAMISMQRDVAAGRDVGIDMHRHKGRYEPLVEGHDSRLAQVFNNLIDNAVSFAPEGTSVEVAVTTDADSVTVTVSDRGRGIQGDPQHIFQRFYTDRPEAEQFGEHSGLGLSISKQIIEAHKGTIAAGNREQGTGAVFTVIMPRARNK